MNKLGGACEQLVQNISIMMSIPNDVSARKEHMSSVKGVLEKVSYVMSALQSGSKGTQACIKAIEVIQD
ncbi:hypothetical protein, partial [Salmonella sp. s51228]|uniref:hypothetical protein n=1 Tax=Salmonella sp. s51228 TaxID=3159652 RepID=UPI00398004F2